MCRTFSASNTSRFSNFADKVCYENGFIRRANFVGKLEAYLDFMEKWYGTSVRDYFEMIYAEQNSLEYVIGKLESQKHKAGLLVNSNQRWCKVSR